MAKASVPVAQKSSSGDLKRVTTSDENYLAYKAGEKIASGAALGSQLDTVTFGGTFDTVGTFTDTFYSDPVGTSSGTSLATGSTTKTLYQKRGAGDFEPTNTSTTFRRPMVESDGSLYEMDDTNFGELAERLHSIIVTNEYPGAKRLAASSPGAGWTTDISNVFRDTRTDGTSVTYNIYQKTSGTEPSKASPVYAKKDTFGAGNTDYDGNLQAMTPDQIKETFGRIVMESFSAANNEVGTYLVRSSAQGAPTADGTWVARGTATDTRNATQMQQYTAQYTGFSEVQYAGTRSYSDDYTGERDFGGTRQFAGSRNYTDQYTSDPVAFTGTRSFSGSRNYTDQYTSDPIAFSGTRQFAGSRNYATQYATNEEGEWVTPPIAFSGSRQFAGSRNFATQYAGDRTYVGSRDFVGTGQVYYAGARAAYYTGARLFYQPGFFGGFNPPSTGFNPPGVNPPSTGVNPPGVNPPSVNPPGVNPPTPGGVNPPTPNGTYNGPIPGIFGPIPLPPAGTPIPGPPGNPFGPTPGNPTPGNPRPGNPYPGNPYPIPGNPFNGNPFPISGNPANFGGTRNRYANQDFVFYWAGQYLGTSNNVQFTGIRDFVGQRAFAGSRNYTSNPVNEYARFEDYVGDRTFTGQRQFAGSRNYTGQYTSEEGDYAGTRQFAGSRNFSGDYVSAEADYTGTRQFAGSRNYTGQYTSAEIQFTGSRQFSGSRSYADDYAGQYTAQYSRQYTGETIISSLQTVETYTLYVKVS